MCKAIEAFTLHPVFMHSQGETLNHRIIAGAMLAFAAFTASATTAQLTVDVLAKTKTVTANNSISSDPGFKPASFSMVFKFDLENPYQSLMLYPGYRPWAMTILDYSTTSSTPTPFTAGMAVLPTQGAYAQGPLTQIAFDRMLSEWNINGDLALPSTERIHFTSSDTWQSPTQGETFVRHSNWRGIEWMQDGPVLSPNQLATATGDEVLAFLQSQVGKSFANAFYEDAWTGEYYDFSSASTGYVYQTGTSIRGDIFIRSVEVVVPEPETLALCAAGLALIAWRRRSMA